MRNLLWYFLCFIILLQLNIFFYSQTLKFTNPMLPVCIEHGNVNPKQQIHIQPNREIPNSLSTNLIWREMSDAKRNKEWWGRNSLSWCWEGTERSCFSSSHQTTICTKDFLMNVGFVILDLRWEWFGCRRVLLFIDDWWDSNAESEDVDGLEKSVTARWPRRRREWTSRTRKVERMNAEIRTWGRCRLRSRKWPERHDGSANTRRRRRDGASLFSFLLFFSF